MYLMESCSPLVPGSRPSYSSEARVRMWASKAGPEKLFRAASGALGSGTVLHEARDSANAAAAMRTDLFGQRSRRRCWDDVMRGSPRVPRPGGMPGILQRHVGLG